MDISQFEPGDVIYGSSEWSNDLFFYIVMPDETVFRLGSTKSYHGQYTSYPAERLIVPFPQKLFNMEELRTIILQQLEEGGK